MGWRGSYRLRVWHLEEVCQLAAQHIYHANNARRDIGHAHAERATGGYEDLDGLGAHGPWLTKPLLLNDYGRHGRRVYFAIQTCLTITLPCPGSIFVIPVDSVEIDIRVHMIEKGTEAPVRD